MFIHWQDERAKEEAGHCQLAKPDLQAHTEVDGVKGDWISAGACHSASVGTLVYLASPSLMMSDRAVINSIAFHKYWFAVGTNRDPQPCCTLAHKETRSMSQAQADLAVQKSFC